MTRFDKFDAAETPGAPRRFYFDLDAEVIYPSLQARYG